MEIEIRKRESTGPPPSLSRALFHAPSSPSRPEGDELGRTVFPAFRSFLDSPRPYFPAVQRALQVPGGLPLQGACIQEIQLLTNPPRWTQHTGSGSDLYNESETITKFEIMDGAPVRGESVPVRLFLSG